MNKNIEINQIKLNSMNVVSECDDVRDAIKDFGMCPSCLNIVKDKQDGRVCNLCEHLTCIDCFNSYNVRFAKGCMICDNEGFVR